MDAAELYIEEGPNADRRGHRQTVEAFLEFARQSSISSGNPRLRSASVQHSPVLGRHSAREETPLTLSSRRHPTQEPEPPSPLLSPSAITPDSEEVECVQGVFVPECARRRSYSDSESSPQTPDPATFQRTLQNIREMSGLPVPTSEERVVLVVRKLKAIADDYNRHHPGDQPRCSLWDIIATALNAPHRAIVNEFANCIKRLHYEDFSWKFVVRFFMVGVRLLESLSSRNVYQEQQSALLGIFLDFLTDKMAKWIEDQGGWESFPTEVQASRDLRRVSSSNAFPSPRLLHQLERIPSEREDGADLPSATPTASAPTCNQPPLVCPLPESAISLAMGQGRSRAISVPARPTSLHLSRSTASHSFPKQDSSFLRGDDGLSHDNAGARSSSSSSTTSQLLSAGVAFAFGVALGSFLTQLK